MKSRSQSYIVHVSVLCEENTDDVTFIPGLFTRLFMSIAIFKHSNVNIHTHPIQESKD